MTANSHFQRLKNIYATTNAAPDGARVAVSYGRAELESHLHATSEDALVTRLPHHRLLSDVASLAAATVEKERFVDAEQFRAHVQNPNYEGAVVASAEVVLAEPPRSVVRAVLRSDDGAVIAEATGVFRPSPHALPSGPASAPEDSAPDDREPAPTPAAFMPIYPTPFGLLCLN